jgi:replication-associated recombination protein RarA
MPTHQSNGVDLPAKYRPDSLSALWGQPHAAAALRSFVKSAIPSPSSAKFVFHGPTGTGKTAAARAWDTRRKRTVTSG